NYIHRNILNHPIFLSCISSLITIKCAGNGRLRASSATDGSSFPLLTTHSSTQHTLPIYLFLFAIFLLLCCTLSLHLLFLSLALVQLMALPSHSSPPIHPLNIHFLSICFSLSLLSFLLLSFSSFYQFKVLPLRITGSPSQHILPIYISFSVLL